MVFLPDFHINMTKNMNNIVDVVGLDIGSSSIKIVALNKKAGEKILTAYNIKTIPSGTKYSGMSDIIKEAFEEIGLCSPEANLAVSGPEDIVRFINLPKMDKSQLKEALTYEAEKYIPFNFNEVVLDSLILGDAQESGQMNVLLAAAKKEYIESRIKMFERAGIKVNIMDIAPFAMFNSFFNAEKSLKQGEGYAFLGLGHTQTDVLISTGNAPCFMRQIQIGGKNVIEELMRGMGIKEKKAQGFVLDVPNKDQAEKESVSRIITEVIEGLTREIQLSFGYFENRYNTSISSVYCCGGMTYRAETINFIKQKLGVDLLRWDPFEKIKISENLSKSDIDTVAAQLTVGVGLALRD